MKTEAIKIYETKGSEVLAHAESICIVDATTREIATEFTTSVRKVIKSIEAEFRPDIEKAHSLHKDLLARVKTLIAPFRAAQGIADREISRDYFEQEKVKREEERKVLAIAEAERKKQEAELAKDAEELINEGNLEAAEELLDSEVITAPVVPVAGVQKTTQTASGSATVKKDIKVEVVDKPLVIKAVLDAKFPYTFIDINIGVAKRYAKASGWTNMLGFKITEIAVVSGRTH